ncbi:hypothetical protein LCGC14_1644860, partial [marine sediment metagenome]
MLPDHPGHVLVPDRAHPDAVDVPVPHQDLAAARALDY